MRIGIIGTAGTGKTTLLNKLVDTNVIKLPEAARTFLSKSDMFENAGYDLNIQSICVVNWQHLEIMNSNKNMDFLTDRTIIDDLALMQILFGKEINLNTVQLYINNMNKDNNQKFLYDKLIIIKNTTNKDFIKENILTDTLRSSKETEEYIKSAVTFYHLVNDLIAQLQGVTKKVIYKEFSELTVKELKSYYA